MYEVIEDEYPFFNAQFNSSVLSVTINYLSESAELGNSKIIYPGMKNITEKAFMYVTTAERDAFLNSLRQITKSD
jgi:hypothetical protein